jgi:hypothetical protein
VRVSRMERGAVHRGFWWGGVSEGQSLGRPRSRWDDCIKMDLQKVGWGNMNWIDLVQNSDRCRGLVNAVTNKRVQ